MITVCCRFAHSLKIMRLPQPFLFKVVPPRSVQRHSSGIGGKFNVLFYRFIEGWEPEIYEFWSFDEDVIREVHPYAQVQISNDFIWETFHTRFFNTREVRLPFLGRRSVNGSVQWLDVPQPFGETGIATVD